MERSYFELYRKFNESLYFFWSSSNQKKKNNLYCLNKLWSRELYQIQISEKYEKPTSQLYYERYFNKFDFDWNSLYLLPRMVTIDTKLRVFQYKILNNILFVNKMLFKFRKVESPLCSFCKAEDETCIHLFYMTFWHFFLDTKRQIKQARNSIKIITKYEMRSTDLFQKIIKRY